MVPSGGADRVHRLEVGPRGTGVSEREVGSEGPVRLVTASVPHPGYPHKTTARGPLVQAADEARRRGGDDALLLAPGETVAEGTIWCLFWWDGDTLCAPPLALEILPGVSRMRIEEIQGQVAERRMPRTALEGRALFLANAVRGIVEVAALDGRPVPSHPATARLRERFWA